MIFREDPVKVVDNGGNEVVGGLTSVTEVRTGEG